ncbi:cytochrome P450 71D10-like [Gastrolobium bilobum]|uniref:cytochrome P450 71D10-like n=1 Tax=Gastrolobium bilobum TaxID=150636 RepID=UPI002AB26F68|nr:cytochrome P450 71D10-like [Gastrolobium bilobum]
MGLEVHIFLSTILPLFLFVFMIINIIWRSKTKNSNSKLPPGPKKLPLIGNIHHLGTLPHRSLAGLANQYGPLMHIQLGELSCIVVSSPQMAKEVMKTHDINFANRPHVLAAEVITYGNKSMSFSPHGTYWRQMRKICAMELLAPKRVESFRSIREEELLNLVKEISLNAGSPMNLSKKIHSLAYGITSRIAFGAKSKDQQVYIDLMKDLSKVVAGFSLADLYPSIGVLQVLTGIKTKVEKMHREIDRILENIVTDHRNRILETEAVGEENGEDLVDVLLRLQKNSDLEHPLSDSIVKATILDIFSAGSDTSSTTIDWAMSELVKNPRVMEKAQMEVRRVFDGKGYVEETSIHELKYLRSVIKETLRLHPPIALLLPRECSERCEINRYEIPPKSKVIVNAWTIGRDPNYWIEAEKFYPERFLDSSIDYKGAEFQFIPFGAGRRICPGITFGIVNVEISLANLLFHFDWKMAKGDMPEELDMTESFGLSVKRKQDLQLIPIIYHSATS